MSIDGIGKRAGIAPSASTPEASTVSKTSFEVGSPEAAAAPVAEVGGGGEALALLERGEISVQQYLDARVESAVAPLLSRLSSEQLEFARGELRSALETDPVLVELVRKVTSGLTSVG